MGLSAVFEYLLGQGGASNPPTDRQYQFSGNRSSSTPTPPPETFHPAELSYLDEAKKLEEKIAKLEADRETRLRAASTFRPPEMNPSPVRPGAAGLTLLLGLLGNALEKGAGSQGAAGFLQGVQQREQTKYQNDVVKANQAQSQNATESQILADQINNLYRQQGNVISEGRYQQGRQDKFSADANAMAKESTRIAQGNRQGFAAANTPAEARYFARLTQGTEFAVSPEELQRQIQDLSQPRIKEFNQRVQALKERFDLQEPDLKALREERANIIKDAGLPESAIPPILSATSYKKQMMDARAAQVQESQKLARERFAEDRRRHKWEETVKFPKDLEVRWAQAMVAQQNAITSGLNNDVARSKFEASLLDNASASLVKDFDKQIRELEMREIALRRAFEQPVGKNDKEKQANAASANQKWQSILDQIDYLKKLRAEQNQARMSVGLPNIELQDRTAIGGAMGFAPMNPFGGSNTVRPMPQAGLPKPSGKIVLPPGVKRIN